MPSLSIFSLVRVGLDGLALSSDNKTHRFKHLPHLVIFSLLVLEHGALFFVLLVCLFFFALPSLDGRCFSRVAVFQGS